MPTPENDSKAGRLSKRINFLKKITKGSKGNILHAMDMVMEEVPESEREYVGKLKSRMEGYLRCVEYYLIDIDSLYELLKNCDPEYKPKHKPRKRKPKGT